MRTTTNVPWLLRARALASQDTSPNFTLNASTRRKLPRAVIIWVFFSYWICTHHGKQREGASSPGRPRRWEPPPGRRPLSPQRLRLAGLGAPRPKQILCCAPPTPTFGPCGGGDVETVTFCSLAGGTPLARSEARTPPSASPSTTGSYLPAGAQVTNAQGVPHAPGPPHTQTHSEQGELQGPPQGYHLPQERYA